MKAELDVKLAKAFVKAMENTNDMALIFFEEGGLKTKLMDSNGYRLLDIRINAEDMISYEFNESNPVEFGIVVNHLKDMTKAMTVKDKHTLLIEYDLENPTWLVLTSCGVKKNLRLLKSSMMKRHKTPNFDSLWSAKIPYKQIKSFLTSIGKTEVFSVNVADEQFKFVAKTDEGELESEITEIDLHFDKSNGDSHEILLGTENFANALSTSGAKTELFVKGGNDSMPLQFEWGFEKLNIKSWVATRTTR
jgi:DNA polymerase III sliding clamp (beta) subunit (PCNA family)